jgi:SAM-dependent methyltransferase
MTSLQPAPPTTGTLETVRGPEDFEDYSQVYGAYDSIRVVVGASLVRGCLASTRASNRARVLDAGCGTGNYLSMLAEEPYELHGLERNATVLLHASRKLGGRAQLREGCVTELPFTDASFDGILCSQVLQHLDRGGQGAETTTAFPNVARFFRQAARVLRPGGVLAINTCSHVQLRDGFWWAALIPEATRQVSARYPAIEELVALTVTAGLAVEFIVADLHGVLQGAAYLDLTGPRSPTWRQSDSTWALASAEEIRQAERSLDDLERSGGMEAFIQEREQRRRTLGQTTFLCVRKPE